MKFRNLFNRKKVQVQKPENLKDVFETKHALCFFSVSTDGHITIKLDESESLNNEIEADKLFNDYIKKQRSVHYHNYRSGVYKFYNNNIGRIIQRKIETKTTKPVNMNYLVAAINYVECDYDNHQLPPAFFSIIYKLLIDEVLGSGYKDLKATKFRTIMKKYGFTTEGRSSFSKYKPRGKYPNWKYESSQFVKDKTDRIEKALSFAERLLTVYKECSLDTAHDQKDDMDETAEETAEERMK